MTMTLRSQTTNRRCKTGQLRLGLKSVLSHRLGDVNQHRRPLASADGTTHLLTCKGLETQVVAPSLCLWLHQVADERVGGWDWRTQPGTFRRSQHCSCRLLAPAKTTPLSTGCNEPVADLVTVMMKGRALQQEPDSGLLGLIC
jgi:hypothetical protein